MTNICSHLPLVDGALGGEVVSPGGLHGGLIHGNHGAVGVGNQSEGTGTVAVASTVGDRGSSVDTSNSDGASQDGAGQATTNGKVVSTGSSHGRLVNRDHGAVGVGHQVGVQVEGSVVTVASSVTGTVDGSSDSDRGSSIGGASQDGAGMATTSGEVVSTGSSHSGLVNRNHGAIRVGHQVRVQVEGAGIAVASSIGGTSDSHGTSSQEGAGTKLGGQVVGLQGSHTGLIDGGDGPVGVRLQAEEALGGREGEGGGENLQKAG